jgi:hypothetical protein
MLNNAMPASTWRLSGGLAGSGGPARENKFLAGRSKYKLDSLCINVGNTCAQSVSNIFIFICLSFLIGEICLGRKTARFLNCL